MCNPLCKGPIKATTDSSLPALTATPLMDPCSSVLVIIDVSLTIFSSLYSAAVNAKVSKSFSSLYSTWNRYASGLNLSELLLCQSTGHQGPQCLGLQLVEHS